MNKFDKQEAISKRKTDIMHVDMMKKDTSNNKKFDVSENIMCHYMILEKFVEYSSTHSIFNV